MLYGNEHTGGEYENETESGERERIGWTKYQNKMADNERGKAMIAYML